MTFDTSKVSKLGFGCMRFDGRDTDSIDIEHTKSLIDRYIAAGGNYFDTAWAYPNSEAALGKALVGRYPRDSYYIATKCIAWSHCTCTEDLEKQLQESLATLGTEYIDVYLMHNLGGPRTEAFRAFQTWEFMKSVKERGLAKHIGFSAHCSPEELEELINEYPDAEVIQLQINYADWESPSFRERECMEIAHKYGKPVVAMEPVKGGLLANPPSSVKQILDAGMPDNSYAAAALRFTASVDGVFTTLSGMESMAVVEENCRTFENFRPLSAEEQATIAKAQEAMRTSGIIACTGCDYCAKVCPQNIGISGSIYSLNNFINYGDAEQANHQLGMVVIFDAGKKPPTECIRCGACEDACPQNIPILECFDRIIEEILPHRAPDLKLMKM